MRFAFLTGTRLHPADYAAAGEGDERDGVKQVQHLLLGTWELEPGTPMCNKVAHWHVQSPLKSNPCIKTLYCCRIYFIQGHWGLHQERSIQAAL